MAKAEQTWHIPKSWRMGNFVLLLFVISCEMWTQWGIQQFNEQVKCAYIFSRDARKFLREKQNTKYRTEELKNGRKPEYKTRKRKWLIFHKYISIMVIISKLSLTSFLQDANKSHTTLFQQNITIKHPSIRIVNNMDFQTLLAQQIEAYEKSLCK